ncbi:MAG: tetratricopeptide repeat protein, partial [Proteobacteria bacterium]|nr:tetratricopeptide repeat protein [Pseudomonadota bacterium]
RQRLQEALALCDASDATCAPLRASILGVLATVAMFTRDHAVAENALEECVRLHDAVDGLEVGVLAQALQALGEFRARQGNYAQALDVLMRACLAYEQASGVDATLQTACHRTLAQVEAHLGMWDEACGCLLKVIDQLEARLGKDHPEIAEVLVECGNIYVLAGQASKAASLFERALGIVRGESDSPQGESYVSVVRALGAMHYREGDLDEAQAFFERALDIRSRNAETDGLQLAESYRELAAVYTARKRTAVARPLLKRALAAYKDFFVPRFAEVAATHRELACTWREDGNLDAEEQALHAALQAQTHAPSGEGLDMVDVLLELADVYVRRGALERADAQRKQAAAVLSETIAALRSSGRAHEAEALERQMHEISSTEEEA